MNILGWGVKGAKRKRRKRGFGRVSGTVNNRGGCGDGPARDAWRVLTIGCSTWTACGRLCVTHQGGYGCPLVGRPQALEELLHAARCWEWLPGDREKPIAGGKAGGKEGWMEGRGKEKRGGRRDPHAVSMQKITRQEERE